MAEEMRFEITYDLDIVQAVVQPLGWHLRRSSQGEKLFQILARDS